MGVRARFSPMRYAEMLLLTAFTTADLVWILATAYVFSR